MPQIEAPSGIYIGNTTIPQLEQYLGIPYATPPVGELRFTNPTLFKSNSTKTFIATAYGPGCSQPEIFALGNGLSEDCLTLNVIKPSGSAKDLPVLFFIHGGGNVNGQSSYYNGTALVQHSMSIQNPIVYVSINYRLGGFGFLNSPEVHHAGLSNLALKDQYVALQWVNKNIKSFGGDPQKVTIFGESAGAANCWAQSHYAFVKKEEKKYFRGMITQSGAPGSPGYPLALSPGDGASEYASILQQVNCTASESLDCLRKVPYEVLSPILVNQATTSYAIDDEWFDANLTYLVESNQFAGTPIIHGSNLNEGTIFLSDPINFPDRTTLFETVASFVTDNQTAITLVDAYFASTDEELGKGVVSDPTAPHGFWVASAVYTDIYFDIGRRQLLDFASKMADTWGYSFRQQPPASSLELSYEYPGLGPEFGKRVGVYHGAELPYVFGEATSLPGHTTSDDTVAIAMMNAWISFAYCLSPICLKDLSGPSWPKYKSIKSPDVLVFEQQEGNDIRVEAETSRPAIYKLWGEALRAIGQHPPF